MQHIFRTDTSSLLYGCLMSQIASSHYFCCNINHFGSASNLSNKNDWLTKELWVHCLWMKGRRSRRIDVQLLCVSDILIFTSTKEYDFIVFHYWIVLVALCNADFIPRFICFCFTYILLVGLLGQSEKSRVTNASGLSSGLTTLISKCYRWYCL
jgi:hypothetical protein